MLFNYKTSTKEGLENEGSIEAPNLDLAVSSLQRRGLIVINISPVGEAKGLFGGVSFFNRVKPDDIVIMSRQIATLFEAKVSVLAAFSLLAAESDNPILRKTLGEVTEDVKGGISISDALAKHHEVFSDFYVSMVKSGEESGKLSETFNYLADYLDRTYALVTKAKNALIYPVFVIVSFLIVMAVMIVFVIPRLSQILTETGQEIPIYTKIVLGTSNFISTYWWLFGGMIVAIGIFLVRYLPTAEGKASFSRFKLSVPYVGDLYKKLYLSRIADNLNTMLTSGVSMVRSLEITADVVDNDIYRNILREASVAIKSGSSMSDILMKYPEIPGIMIQMVKVGEETGKLGYVLETLAKFYRREVDIAVETIVGLIEPIMIVFLGLAVGILLTSVLVPIYNVASGL